MRSRGIAAFAAAVLLCALCAAAAAADTMVVAGKQTVSATRFVLDAGDVFVPMLPGLRPLIADFIVGSDAVRLTTHAGREIIISRERPEATVDGTLRTMPAPPKMAEGMVLLPAKALGSLLGCGVRWDEPARTLYMHPWVRQFAVEAMPDRYRVVVGAEAPLRYQVIKMQSPFRLVVDLADVDLSDVPPSVAIGQGYLQYARIAQKALAPEKEGDLVRVVIGMTEWKQYRVKLSDDRCQLQIDLPLPGRDLPSDAPPITLLDLNFHRYSSRLAALTIATSGKAHFTSGKTDDPATIWVEVENAANLVQMPDPPPTDRLVKDIKLEPVEDKPGTQRLTLALAAPTPFQATAGARQLRILLGQAELSGLAIVVDAGHGGWDPGAVGRTGLSEKEVDLDIALRLQRLLEEAGARVVMTRDSDSSVNGIYNGNTAGRRKELYTRCNIANDSPADLYVAVHCNSRGSASRCGTETFYRKSDSATFARILQEEVVRVLGRPNGGAQRHPEAIIVLHATRMPAVLVEVAYISNSVEESLLATPEFRQQAAQGILNGIARYALEAGLLPRLPPPPAPSPETSPAAVPVSTDDPTGGE